MKIVYNVSHGGFLVPGDVRDQCGLDYYADIERNDPRLVEFVEAHGGCYEEGCALLCVVEVPENTTDFLVTECDGEESVYYVVDGKIHCAV